MAKRILSLFRNLFRKRAIEQALDDELRSTLEALTQENIEQGPSQSVARRKALIEIGGIEQVKEGVRAVRVGHFVEHLAGDIRYGLRQLRRNRSFTALALERDCLLRQHDAEIAHPARVLRIAYGVRATGSALGDLQPAQQTDRRRDGHD